MKFRKKSRFKGSNGESFMLTGKLFCGQCSASMVGTSGTSKRQLRYYYYVCNNRLKKAGCKAKYIRADLLEELVCRVTTDILSDMDAVRAIARQAVEAQKERKASLILQSLHNQRDNINKKLHNCVQAVENGLISTSVANRIQEYEKTLTELEEDIAREELLSRASILTEKHIEFFFCAIAQKIKTADKYKSILLSSLIRCVIVHEDYIEIQYNYKNELPVLQNPVKVKGSDLSLVAEREGFEPSVVISHT